MKRFRICRHPDGTLEAVKEGWCWPGAIFGGFWLLYRRMYGLGTTALVVGSLLYGLFPFAEGYIQGIPYGYRPGPADAANLLICLLIGALGNSWYLDSLNKRGFEMIDVVDADTPDGARAAYLCDQHQGDSHIGGERREPTM